jgi:hypothetical protein
MSGCASEPGRQRAGVAVASRRDRALDGDEGTVLEDEICIIQAEHYFVRARLVIPVLDADDDFEWGVWVSLSRHNFRDTG